MKNKDLYTELKKYDKKKERQKIIKSAISVSILGIAFFSYMIFVGWDR